MPLYVELGYVAFTLVASPPIRQWWHLTLRTFQGSPLSLAYSKLSTSGDNEDGNEMLSRNSPSIPLQTSGSSSAQWSNKHASQLAGGMFEAACVSEWMMGWRWALHWQGHHEAAMSCLLQWSGLLWTTLEMLSVPSYPRLLKFNYIALLRRNGLKHEISSITCCCS